MNTYLVRTEHKNGFINVRPVMELMTDGFFEVDENKFGQYGTINVNVPFQFQDSPFLQDGKYSMLVISDSELEGLEQTYSGQRIRAVDFLAKAKPVNEFHIKEAIYLPDGLKIEDFLTWKTEYISNVLPPITKTVFLIDNLYVAGPFLWEGSGDGQFRFLPKASASDPYMIDCFSIKDFDTIYKFEAGKYSDPYAGRDRYIIDVPALPEKSLTLDLMDDSALKEYIGKIISQSAETKRQQKEIRDAVINLPQAHISESRQNRILSLAQNGELADQIINLLPSVILENQDQKEKIAELIVSNDNYLQKLYSVARTQEGFQSLLEKLESDKREKEKELQYLEQRIEEAKDSSSSQIQSNSEELDKLAQENALLQDRLNAFKEIDDIQSKYDALLHDYEQVQSQYQAITSMSNNLEQEISQKIKSAYTSFAFDGAISSLMLQEAANFELLQNQKRVAADALTIERVKDVSRLTTPQEVIHHLHSELTAKAHRSMTENDIANFLLCISQGFLTVLAGEPGTGKTSLVSLLARLLGLSNSSNSRYVEVAVEKGWTSRRDFIGYYNPLTKSFDTANRGVFSALSILNAEAKSGTNDFPFWILLDEANLSQMEHYWADFMSLCDLDKLHRKLSLSEDYEFEIPETLRFIATINLDHTTEILSPRLIDRTWILMLNGTNIDIEDHEEAEIDDNYPLVINRIFSELNHSKNWKSMRLDDSIISKLHNIQKIFRTVNIHFSPRLIGMLKRYCLASNGLFDTSENSYVALDYAVAQKVLPMINGYGERYGNFISDLLKECDQNSMPKSNQILLEINEKAAINMQYYQFFAR